MTIALLEAGPIRDPAVEQAAEFVMRRLYRLEQQHIRTLLLAYGEARRRMLAVLDDIYYRYLTGDVWRASDGYRARRTTDLLDQVDAIMQELTGALQGRMEQTWPAMYRGGYYAGAWQLGRELGADFPIMMPIIPYEAVTAASLFPYEGLNWFERYGEQRGEFIAKLRRSITVSQIQGETMPQARRRLQEELRISRNKAELISRTEMMRASNLGAQAVEQANADILQGWEWLTAHDERVCPQCGPRDGHIYSMGQAGPPLHPRCRCQRLPVTRSAADLGLPAEIEAPYGPRLTWTQWKARQGLSDVAVGGMAE